MSIVEKGQYKPIRHLAEKQLTDTLLRTENDLLLKGGTYPQQTMEVNSSQRVETSFLIQAA